MVDFEKLSYTCISVNCKLAKTFEIFSEIYDMTNGNVCGSCAYLKKCTSIKRKVIKQKEEK